MRRLAGLFATLALVTAPAAPLLASEPAPAPAAQDAPAPPSKAPAPPPAKPPVPALRKVSVCYVHKGKLVEAKADYDSATGKATFEHEGKTVTVEYATYQGVHVGGPYAKEQPWYKDSKEVRLLGKRYVKYGLPRVLGVNEVTSAGAYKGVTFFKEPGAPKAPEILYAPVQMFCEFQPYQLVVPRKK